MLIGDLQRTHWTTEKYILRIFAINQEMSQFHYGSIWVSCMGYEVKNGMIHQAKHGLKALINYF